MMFQKLALFICLGISSVDAFSVGKPSSSVAFLRQTAAARPSTCIYAESADGAEESPSAEADTADDHMLPDEGHSDILSSPAFLQRKLEVLHSDLAKYEEDLEEANKKTQEGKAEWGDQIEALNLEYANVSKRMSEQSKTGDVDAIIQVARNMLGVLDNFDRCFGIVEPETDEEKAVDAAYREVYQNILNTFEELGVTEVETLGKEFDYEVHQAVMQRPDEDYEEGFVCEELAKGFIIGEKLIRAAMVSVAA